MNYNNSKIKYFFLCLFALLIIFMPMEGKALTKGEKITIYSTGKSNVDGLAIANCVDGSTICPDWYSYFYTKSFSSNSYMKMFCVAPSYESVPSQSGTSYFYLGNNYDIVGVGAACAYINNNIDSKYINWNVSKFNSFSDYVTNDRNVRKYIFDNIGSKTKCTKYTKDTSISDNHCNSKNQAVSDDTNSSIGVGVGSYGLIVNGNKKYQQAEVSITKKGKISNYKITVSGVNGAIITATNSATDVTNITNSSATTLYVKVPVENITDSSKIRVTVEGSYELKCNYIMPTIKVFYPVNYVNSNGNALSETGKKYYDSTTGLYKITSTTSAIQAVGYFDSTKGADTKSFTKSDVSTTIPPKLSNLRIRKLDYQNNLIKDGQAKFSLYKDNQCSGSKVSVNGINEFSTNNGELIIENLSLGSYYIKETQTPGNKYFMPTNNCREVKLEVNNYTYTVSIVNDRPIFIINKYDTSDANDDNDANESAKSKLYGAEFNIYKDSNCSENEKINTVSLTSGTYRLENIEINSRLSIKEVKSPSGYTVNNKCIDLSSYMSNPVQSNVSYNDENENKYSIEKVGSTGKIYNVNVYNDKKVEYKIKKVNSKKNDDNDNHELIKTGTAKFSIYKNKSDCNNSLNPISSIYTTEGEASILLDKGNYYAKEIQSPQGYVIDSTCKQLSDSTAVEFINDREVEVTIKKEGQSKTSSVTYISLSNVKFNLYNNNNCEGIPRERNIASDSNGKIKRILTEGYYSVKETATLPGYTLDENCYSFEIAASGVVSSENADVSGSEIVLKNSLELSSLEITKKDDDEKLLSKVTFGLFSDSTCAPEKEIDKNKTNTEGKILFEGLDSTKSIYYKEIDNDEKVNGYITIDDVHYKIDSNCYKANLVPGETTKVIVYNHKLENLIIEKKNAFGQVLEGAEFSIYSDNTCNTKITHDNKTEFVTDKNGRISLKLEGTDYYVKEIGAPDGYKKREDDCKHVNLVSGDNKPVSNSVVFINDKLVDVKVKKISTAGNYINGVEFELYESNDCTGNSKGTYTTEDYGTFTIVKLDPEINYSLKEVKKPDDYYLLNNNSCTVINDKESTENDKKIKLNEDKEITIINGKKTSISFKKVNNFGEPISGVKFKLYLFSGNNVKGNDTVSSDDNGLVRFDGLELSNLNPDSYVITEIYENTDYFLPTKNGTDKSENYSNNEYIVKTGTLDEVSYYSNIYLSDVINVPYSKLEIIKVNDKNETLSGASFNLYESTDNVCNKDDFKDKEPIAADNAANGIVFKLEYGNYCLVEEEAPEGYIKGDDPISVAMGTGQNISVVVENAKMPSLKVFKRDNFGNPLEGVVFDIFKTTNNSCSGIDVSTLSPYEHGSITTGGDGYGSIADLNVGSYCVVEKSTPNGYVKDENPQIVSLEGNDNKVVVFENDILPELKILKVDENGNSLSGAKFQIYNDNECKSAVEDVGNLNLVTNNEGIISIRLNPRKYYVKEIEAPDGYQLNNECTEVELKANERTVLTEINKLKRDIRVTKIGNISNLPVKDVQFKLYKDSKCSNELDSKTTGDDGVVLFTGLNDGKYYVKEDSVPYGYIKDDACHEVVAGSNDLVIKNDQYFDLTIEKKDATTDAPIEGVKFKLCLDSMCSKTAVHYDGTAITDDELTTNSNGILTIKGLLPGNYYYQEVRTAEDYVLTDAISGILISDNQTLIVKNSKYNLKINKVSLENEKVNLPGSKINIVDLSSDTLDLQSFVSTDKVSSVSIAPGIYAIYEADAPDGFIPLESGLIFKINSKGEYEKYVGDYSQYESVIGIPLEIESDNYIVDGNSIKIVNKPTYVILSKADVTSAKEVPGATVIIYDSNNHEVVKFISDDKGPKLFYLEPGEYTLKETIAPKGYKKLTSTFKFTLTEGGTILTDNKDESYFVKGDTIIIYNGMDTINVPITGLSKNAILIIVGILLIGSGTCLIVFRKKKA